MDERFFTDRVCGSVSPHGRTCQAFWEHAGCCTARDADAKHDTKASERWWDADAQARQDPPISKMFRAGLTVIPMPGLAGWL